MPFARPADTDAAFDVCIVGAGPAGLAAALGCAERGLKVMVLEAGGRMPVPGEPDLLSADIADIDAHDPTELTSAHALGGSSHWWGGRIVPMAPIDVETWPVSYSEIRRWSDVAAAWLGGCLSEGDAPPPAFARLSNFSADGDEVWCLERNVAKRWRARLAEASGPALLLRARVIGFELQDGSVSKLRVRCGGEVRSVIARKYVLACGGLGTLKLLLCAQAERPELFGGTDGPLGRGYGGHLTGTIAELSFAHSQDLAAFTPRTLPSGHIARRQIRARSTAVRDKGAAQIAWWQEQGRGDATEFDPVVSSAKLLAARLGRAITTFGARRDGAPLAPHIRRLRQRPVLAAIGLSKALRRLMALPSPPVQEGAPPASGSWHLRYHAEQRPGPDNRVALAGSGVDSAGLPRLSVRLQFSQEDARAVVKAHQLLDADLRAAGAGHLVWRASVEACTQSVLRYARDGYHQMGGAIMSDEPRRGIVDADCRVHGLVNLWLASSSVFPTAGQANPTLTVVALALRLAAHLAGSPGGVPERR
ncbi:MAG: GMC family oxidoreductase [Hyphomonas sp.]